MAKAKLTTIPALLAAATLGGVGVYFYDGESETYEQVILPPAPITDALLLTAPQDCLAEIQATGDDPSCELVTAWHPNGGKTVYPETLVYDVNGEVVPPGMKEMLLLNSEKRTSWSCNGAVMPARVQDCLDTLHAEAPVEAVE